MATGKFVAITSQLNDLVLDIRRAEIENDTEVITYNFHNHDNQLWYYDNIKHVIRSKANEQFVLDTRDEDNKLAIREFDETRQSQRMVFSDGYLVQLRSGQVMQVEGGNEARATNVVPADWATDKPCQKWTFQYQPRQYFVMKSRMNGKVMDVTDGRTDPGTPVTMQGETGEDNQLWYEDRWGTIYSKLNGLSLEFVPREGLKTAPFDGTNNNKTWAKSGLTIANRSGCNRVLDINEANHDDGAWIVGFRYHGHDNQHWDFVYVREETE